METGRLSTILIAWNAIVENKSEHMTHWEQMVSEGNPLEQIRGQQMIDLVAEGKIVKQIPEHTAIVLESMEVEEETVTVRFLDGAVKVIRAYKCVARIPGSKY